MTGGYLCQPLQLRATLRFLESISSISPEPSSFGWALAASYALTSVITSLAVTTMMVSGSRVAVVLRGVLCNAVYRKMVRSLLDAHRASLALPATSTCLSDATDRQWRAFQLPQRRHRAHPQMCRYTLPSRRPPLRPLPARSGNYVERDATRRPRSGHYDPLIYSPRSRLRELPFARFESLVVGDGSKDQAHRFYAGEYQGDQAWRVRVGFREAVLALEGRRAGRGQTIPTRVLPESLASQRLLGAHSALHHRLFRCVFQAWRTGLCVFSPNAVMNLRCAQSPIDQFLFYFRSSRASARASSSASSTL